MFTLDPKIRGFGVLADAAGQTTFEDALGDDLGFIRQAIKLSLLSIEEEGSLLNLQEFSDTVQMHPLINLGKPCIRDSSLETHFVAHLVSMSSLSEIAELYGIQHQKVERAVAFEEAVA
jgi:uncharacterized protein (DUF433 family)